MRKEVISLGENFNGRFHGTMHQQLGSPIEEVGLARAHFRRALVLLNGFERITQFLLNVAQQVM